MSLVPFVPDLSLPPNADPPQAHRDVVVCTVPFYP